MTSSNWPPPPRSARRASRRRTPARRPSLALRKFSRIVLTAAGAESTNSACAAPRDRASMPTAPVPANRSRTRAHSTRAPREENSPSRARSDIGRVPAGTGARRTPRAEPAITRTRGLPSGPATSAVEQPLDGLAAEASTQQRQQLGMPVQLRIGLDEGEGPGPGALHQCRVLGEARQLEVG